MGLPSGHTHCCWEKPHQTRALSEVIASNPLCPPRGKEGTGSVQRVVSGYPGHKGGRRTSSKGGGTGSEKGHDVLRFHEEPLVEPAELSLLARRPPHLAPALDAKRLQRGRCPLSRAVVSFVELSGHPGCVGALRAHHSCVTSSGVCARA